MGRRIKSAIEKKTGSCSLCKGGRSAGNANGADKKGISNLEGKLERTTEKGFKTLVGLETIPNDLVDGDESHGSSTALILRCPGLLLILGEMDPGGRVIISKMIKVRNRNHLDRTYFLGRTIMPP